MRIALDAQLAIGTSTGIGEYVIGLARALRARGVDVVELNDPGCDPWRFDRRLLWDQFLLPRAAGRSGARLLHCTSGTMPLRLALPTVVTVHDVAWLRVQSHARAYARYYFGRFALERYRRADCIMVDSAFSRRELLEISDFEPERIRVVYPGVAEDFAALPRGAGDGRTILAVGTVERRKNLEALIRLLPSLPTARVVSVGPFTPYREECMALARELRVDERLEFRGYVARSELLALYATCAVAAVPSQYEGFGYGVAQALCAGTPCVTSDAASLPDVAGIDASVVSLDDTAGWIAALEAGLSGASDAHAAAARPRAIERFAWDKSAADTIAVYQEVLARA